MSGNLGTVIILLAATSLLAHVLGRFASHSPGPLLALGILAGSCLAVYRAAGASSNGRRATNDGAHGEAPALAELVAGLAYRARIQPPRVVILASDSARVSASGRDPARATIAVTTGLLRLLSRRELCAVLAHEIIHIQRRDARAMTWLVAASVAVCGFTQLAVVSPLGSESTASSSPLAGLVMLLTAPMLTVMGILGIARARELAADLGAARLVGDPYALASALWTLSQRGEAKAAGAPPREPAPSGVGSAVRHDWSTLLLPHPPVRARIARLTAMPSLGQAN
jgi:heat shock protein HtpX